MAKAAITEPVAIFRTKYGRRARFNPSETPYPPGWYEACVEVPMRCRFDMVCDGGRREEGRQARAHGTFEISSHHHIANVFGSASRRHGVGFDSSEWEIMGETASKPVSSLPMFANNWSKSSNTLQRRTGN